MSTLYVSDLDATLLNSKAQITPETVRIINSLTEKGMLFTFATARSAETALRVTEGLKLQVPIIVYTGTFIVDTQSRRRIVSNFMRDSEVEAVLSAVKKFGIIPIVYSYIDDEERFIYDREIISEGVARFIETREGDKRNCAVSGGFEKTLKGDIFYFTFMEKYQRLKAVYEYLKDKCNCLFQPDNYTENWFLEVMPEAATKAKAALSLKEILGADKLVSFGDGINDIRLLQASDEAYAVSDCEQELRAFATDIIGSCDEDAVARWLLENFRP